MENEEILKENNCKKFDVVLMNPPYGSKTTRTSPHLHLEFTNKCLNIADEVISIFPDRLITSTSKEYDKYKKYFDERLESIEQIKAYEKFDIKVGSVGIFTFRNNKSNNIEIIDLEGNKETINSLSEKTNKFTEYENKIFEYCKVDKPNFNPFRPIGYDKKEGLEKFCDKYINKRWPNNNKVFLTTALANGGMNARFIFGNTGIICHDNNELKDLMIKHRGACCTIMTFNSIKEAENCKIALQNPLMRFLLYKLQDDQNMTARVYVGVPNIDWSDDRVKTDEGLLEVCGCPKDKCKEYAEYCKKIIEQVDKK